LYKIGLPEDGQREKDLTRIIAQLYSLLNQEVSTAEPENI
jgi:hypothetical protein